MIFLLINYLFQLLHCVATRTNMCCNCNLEFFPNKVTQENGPINGNNTEAVWVLIRVCLKKKIIYCIMFVQLTQTEIMTLNIAIFNTVCFFFFYWFEYVSVVDMKQWVKLDIMSRRHMQRKFVWQNNRSLKKSHVLNNNESS